MTIYHKPKGISRTPEDVEGDRKKAERLEKKINKKLIRVEQVAIEYRRNEELKKQRTKLASNKVFTKKESDPLQEKKAATDKEAALKRKQLIAARNAASYLATTEKERNRKRYHWSRETYSGGTLNTGSASKKSPSSKSPKPTALNVNTSSIKPVELFPNSTPTKESVIMNSPVNSPPIVKHRPVDQSKIVKYLSENIQSYQKELRAANLGYCDFGRIEIDENGEVLFTVQNNSFDNVFCISAVADLSSKEKTVLFQFVENEDDEYDLLCSVKTADQTPYPPLEPVKSGELRFLERNFENSRIRIIETIRNKAKAAPNIENRLEITKDHDVLTINMNDWNEVIFEASDAKYKANNKSLSLNLLREFEGAFLAVLEEKHDVTLSPRIDFNDQSYQEESENTESVGSGSEENQPSNLLLKKRKDSTSDLSQSPEIKTKTLSPRSDVNDQDCEEELEDAKSLGSVIISDISEENSCPNLIIKTPDLSQSPEIKTPIPLKQKKLVTKTNKATDKKGTFELRIETSGLKRKITPEELTLFYEPDKRDQHYGAKFTNIDFDESKLKTIANNQGKEINAGIFNDSVIFMADFKNCSFEKVNFSQIDREILNTVSFYNCKFSDNCIFPKGFKFKDSSIRGGTKEAFGEVLKAKTTLFENPIKPGNSVEEAKAERVFASLAMERLRNP